MNPSPSTLQTKLYRLVRGSHGRYDEVRKRHQYYGRGSLIPLTEPEARSLGDRIEEVVEEETKPETGVEPGTESEPGTGTEPEPGVEPEKPEPEPDEEAEAEEAEAADAADAEPESESATSSSPPSTSSEGESESGSESEYSFISTMNSKQVVALIHDTDDLATLEAIRDTERADLNRSSVLDVVKKRIKAVRAGQREE